MTVTNALGKDTIYTTTVHHGVIEAAQIDGQATTMCGASTRSVAYDANGYVDTRTDEKGYVTDYGYNARGLLETKTEAVGTTEERITTTTWHPDFRVPSQIAKSGQTIDMAYDASGRLLTRTITDTQIQSVPYSTNGNARTWTYAYNSLGLVETVDGPRTDVSDVTTYEYDVNGDLTTITNALGQVTEITARDPRGYPTQLEDVNDVVTDLTYDTRGRLTSRTVKSSQGDAVTTFDYDAVGQVIGITLPDGSQLVYEYDAAHRLTAMENGLGERIEYTLDAAGNRTAETVKDSGGSITRTMSRVYDELSRLRDSLGANGQSTDLDYDNNDNLTQIEDGLSRITGQSFDALDRLIEVTDPALNDATYAYDNRDNLTHVTDPGGVATSYVYDGLDNLIQESSPDAGTTVHEYEAGNLTKTTDGRGIVVEYAYDALNRVTAITYPASAGENVTYTYDTGTNGVGRLHTVTDESGTTTYTYDDRGNVLSVARNTGSETFVTSYTHDLADNVTSITYPSGRTVTYGRDALGRISGATSQIPAETSETLASSVTYEPFGPMAAWTSGNGVTNSRSFDQDYRVTDVEISGSGMVHDLSYGYNVVDNITSLTDQLNASLSQTFDYDDLNRLTDADGDYGGQTYAYDANGNRTQRDNATTLETQTLTYTTGTNQLATEDSQAVVHDGAGNRTSDEGGSRTYAYNHAGRLTQFTEASVLQADYTYNAQGQRVMKVRHVGASAYVRHFFYDQAGRLIGEYRDNPDGTYAYVDYVWLNEAPLVQEERSFSSAGVLTGTQTTWLHVDHLNTPRVGTNDGQIVAWRWDSDPFGVGAADTDPDNDSTDHIVLLRFPGQYEDEESGNYYNYFRHYDPMTGRYITSDPIGVAGGLNTYAYVDGNPLRYIDPYGLSKFDQFFGLPKQFWNWLHRHPDMKHIKGPDGQVPKDLAEQYHKEWKDLGQPGPYSKGKHRGSADANLLEWLVPLYLIPLMPSEIGSHPCEMPGGPLCIPEEPVEPAEPEGCE